MKQRVLLLCALKLRDLPVLTVLKLLFEKNGLHADVLSSQGNFRLIKSYPADILVLPHLFSKEFAEVAKQKKKEGALIVVMPTENISKSFELLVQQYKYAKDFIGLADLYLVWGSETKKILVKTGILPENKVKIVGCPRCDFYSKKFIDLLDKNAIYKKYGLDPDKKLVTWATGYGYSDLPTEHAKNSIEQVGISKLIDPYDFIEYERKARAQAIDAFFNVAKRSPEIQFLIKIHPSEYNTQLYTDKKNDLGLTNVNIVRKSSLYELILISDLWLHWNSTTSAEAWLLNKPTLQLYISTAKKFIFEEIAHGSLPVNNEKDFEKYVNFLKKNKKIVIPRKKILLQKRTIKNWLGPFDGKSIEKHYQEIMHARKVKKSTSSIFTRFNIVYFFLCLVDFVKRIFNLETHESMLKFFISFKRQKDLRQKFFSRQELTLLEKEYKKLLHL